MKGEHVDHFVCESLFSSRNEVANLGTRENILVVSENLQKLYFYSSCTLFNCASYSLRLLKFGFLNSAYKDIAFTIHIFVTHSRRNQYRQIMHF